MKKLSILFILFPFLGITQEIDSLDFQTERNDIQYYKISDYETFSYQ